MLAFFLGEASWAFIACSKDNLTAKDAKSAKVSQ